MSILLSGFQWDDGNWPKCAKHGVSKDEVESALRNAVVEVPDPDPSEARLRTVGRTDLGRFVFVVFTYRSEGNETLIRPISARFMHTKEIATYVEYEKTLAQPKDRQRG